MFKNVFLITPNEKESLEMSSCSDITMAGNFLRKELDSNILITQGKKGMSLFSDKNLDIPTYAKDIYDVTGAGDTSISTLALSIAAGASLEEAAIIANHAASISVEKKGTYSVDFKELRDKILIEKNKMLNFEELKKKVLEEKRKGKKIVWTNGCFDLLHVGHVYYLKEAKKLGDVLIVGINSDESVKKLKGEGRPLQLETERAEILSSLEFIDHVIIFPELSVEKYLFELQPEIYVKGGDYTIDSINLDERKVVKGYGGKINFVPLVEGKSSTNIIEKISKNNRNKNDLFLNK